jgi:diguanylate cyclase (GGDEF)-like protein/PAS domain S-box-containing protein
MLLSESQLSSEELAFLVGKAMLASPKFTRFGIDREHNGYHSASPDDAPILEGFFKKMLDELYDGVYFVNTERRILYWNAAAERLSGYAASEVVGSLCFDNILDHTDSAGCHLCQEGCPLAATMQLRKQLCKRVYLKHKDGNRIAVEVRVSPVMDERGRTIGAVEIFRDAGSDLALESAYRSARELAQKDPLTGLANRRSLSSFVSEQLELFRRSGRRFSVFMVDLDHFKAVNDTRGHATGDRVLAEIARVLLESSREMDLVGRYGGEEFVVVLPNTSLDQAAAIAERVRAELGCRQCGAAPGIPAITASIGVADSCPGDDWESLISRVDAALYEAKQQGRNRVQVSRHLARIDSRRDSVQDFIGTARDGMSGREPIHPAGSSD